MPKAPKYDCAQCPGYCCSYPRIIVSEEDIARLARHHGLEEKEARKKFTQRYRWASETETIDERVLRHRPDTVYTSTCQFLHPTERRCTIYEARPQVCREYPNSQRCGYYSFLKFERKQQGDLEFIPSA